MPPWLNLANLFTTVRLAMVPFIIRAVLAGRNWHALTLFVLAGATDVLDGAAARRLGQATPGGAYLDPIADKFLLSGVFVALAMAGAVPVWYVVLVFGRDLYILVAALVLMLATPLRRFPPSRWGKASTFFQIATAVAWMTRSAAPAPAVNAAAIALLWISAGLTLCSGIHYTWRGAGLARAH